MTSLHALYLQVKDQVAAAVAAVNSATEAAAQIAHQAIQDALAAVEALDDYLDFFGLVGDPLDAAVELLLEQLYNLAKVLDDRGYYAIYNKTFGAANQYANAKKAYDGFTGGHGGTSGGGGASSGWFGLEQKNYPLYDCHNRNGAKLNEMGPCIAPTEDQVDYTVILGGCSEVFVYGNNDINCEWENGIYQFVRWRVLLWFWDKDVIFPLDYGKTPKYSIDYWPSNYSVIVDRSAQQYFANDGMIKAEDGWGGAGPIVYWPVDTSWKICDANGESNHDRQISVIGKYEYNGKEYWLYNESYWFASHQKAYRDANNQPINNGNPDQVLFVKICGETTPGKNIKPWAPWAISLLVGDEEKKKKLAKALRLGLDLRPYDLCCKGQKILCDGQQVTCGDPEGV